MPSSPPFSAGWLWCSGPVLQALYSVLESCFLTSSGWTDEQLLGMRYLYLCIQQNWLRHDIISEDSEANLQFMKTLIGLELGLAKVTTEDLKRLHSEPSNTLDLLEDTRKRLRTDEVRMQMNDDGEEEVDGDDVDEVANAEEEADGEVGGGKEAQNGKEKGKGKGKGKGKRKGKGKGKVKGTRTAANGGGRGKGGGGGPGGSHCQRGANRARAKGAQETEMQSVEEGDEEGMGQWEVRAEPAPPTSKVRLFLSQLGNLNTSEKAAAIEDLVVAIGNLGQSTANPWQMTSLDNLPSLSTCIQNCLQDETMGKLHAFSRMMNLITLVMVLDKEIETHNHSVAIIATQHEIKIGTLQDWRHRGLKLVELACGGTLYLIIIIAALGMYKEVTQITDVISVSTIARILRDPQDDPTGQIVREIVIPCIAQLAQDNRLSALRLIAPCDYKTIPFFAFNEIDDILGNIATNNFILPLRNDLYWSSCTDIMLSRSQCLSSISEGHTFQTEYALKDKICTLPKDRVSWTELERSKAANAPVAVNLDQLEQFLTSPDRNLSDDDQYIRFSSSTLQGKSLNIRDRDLEPIALLLTNMEHILGPKMALVASKLKALFWKENFDDSSRREGFSFLAQHYNMCYNRYAEKGTGAPTGVHPDYLGKRGKSHINFSQRLPHMSKDILDNMEEFNLLSDMLSDIGSFVAEN
ncbi:hypothetical protein H0H93_012480, partial [Arthromyces matolae]